MINYHKLKTKFKPHLELICYFIEGNLTFEELYLFVKENSYEDIKRFIGFSDITIAYLKKLSYFQFKNLYSQFIRKQFKYHRYKKIRKHLKKFNKEIKND